MLRFALESWVWLQDGNWLGGRQAWRQGDLQGSMVALARQWEPREVDRSELTLGRRADRPGC